MNTVLEMLLLSGTKQIAYILRDIFATARAAGAINGTSVEPGPGTRIVADTENKLSIINNALVFDGPKATPGYNNPGCNLSAAQSKKAGRTLFVDFIIGGGDIAQIGWSNANNGQARHGAIFTNIYTGGLSYNNGTSSLATVTISSNILYRAAFVMRATGTYAFIQGGIYSSWQLIYVDPVTSDANRYVGLQNYNAYMIIKQAFVADLGSPFDSAYGYATNYVASPATGEVTTMTADALIEFTWKPGANEIVDFMVRRTDDSNCWIIRCDQAAGKIYLYEKNLGTETERGATGGIAATWTVGTNYIIMVWAKGNSIKVMGGTDGRTANQSYGSATFNNTATGVKVSGFATGYNLATYPMNTNLIPSLYNLRTPGASEILIFGDSKSLAESYNYRLLHYLDISGTYWKTSIPFLSVGGASVASRKASIDSDLSTHAGNPIYILWNLGANDVGALPAEATWKANAQYCIDALHAKWPTAKIYFMQVWERGKATECNTIDGWYADLVTSNPGVCFIGPDERVFLENGDNGVTYTADGIHPNAAGYALTAINWKTVLGF